MNILIIVPYKGYFSNFASLLIGHIKDEKNKQKAEITTVMPPYYSVYSKTGKMLNKKQLVIVMFYNFFYFLYKFVLHRKKRYDIIILASNTVTIPYLFLTKLFSFVDAIQNVIVMSFLLHGAGKNKAVKRLLRYLFKRENIFFVAQSDYEIEYYSTIMGKNRVIHFPYCQHEVSVADEYGQGQEYIFTGGYTNRDYECIFHAARKVKHKFICICSRMNAIREREVPDNVRILNDTSSKEFNGYLKNSKIIIIPLKEKTGSSGQRVVLTAMCFKKPIIYTNIDSISQYFENGVSGIGYEINNSEDLAEKINKLLSDTQLQNIFGKNAYKRYCEKYHISSYCENMTELISNLEQNILRQ